MNGAIARIVVGYDGSPSSQQALDWAVDQATLERRGLTVAYAATDPAAVWSSAVVPVVVQSHDELEAAAREVLAEARDRVRTRAPGLDVTEHLEFTDPREVLLQLSDDAETVVLGSRGRGPVRSLLLGSVGAALARHASCPVVIHRPRSRRGVLRGALVAIDTTKDAHPVLEAAFSLASMRDLPLTVMHCHWDPTTSTLGVYAPAPSDLELDRLDVAEAVAGLGEKYPDVHVSLSPVVGPPEAEVCAASRQMDMLVLGASRTSPVARMLFGSLSLGIVEHAECPVTVVPVTRRS